MEYLRKWVDEYDVWHFWVIKATNKANKFTISWDKFIEKQFCLLIIIRLLKPVKEFESIAYHSSMGLGW